MQSEYKKYIDLPIFHKISEVLSKEGIPAFVIGGYVRDCFLDRPCKDIDIVVLGSGIDAAQKVATALDIKNVSYFKNFGTAMFQYEDLEIEFVGARKESYQRDSRKPIVENGSLEDDQNRRDFTINAMALSLNKSTFGLLIDPFDGISDLKKKIIKTPLAPEQTFSDDPLRMMRAVRFATQLNFRIEKNCLEAIKKQSERLNIISGERTIDEVNKIIATPKPSLGFKLLFNTELLHQFFPEMVALQGIETINGKSHKDNFYHTLEVLDNICETTDDLWLRWAAIMHDIAKPPTKRFQKGHGFTFHGHEDMGAKMVPKIFTRLKLPLDQKMKYVQKLVRLHLRPIALVNGNVSDSAIRRLLYEAGDDIDDLMKLCEADITSKNEFKVQKFKKNFKLVRQKLREVEEKDHVRNFQPPISGKEIMNLYGLEPSKLIGDIKNEIKEAILEGTIPNEYDAAKKYMENILKKKNII